MKRSKEAEEIFNSFTEYLKANGKIDKIDEFTFRMLAAQIHVFLENEKKIYKDGSVQVYKTGHSNISGYYNAMNKSMDYITNLSYKLGIYEIIKEKLHAYGKIPIEGSEFLK